ncbi:MAG: TniB family NTP-binding protein [Microthrixaceae bacterium]
MIQFHSTDRPTSLHRYEGLTTYLESDDAPPKTLSSRQFAGLSAAEREAYDRGRVLHLSGGILLNTPYLAQAKRLLTDCFKENVGSNSGHTGLMLSGNSTLGKTTIAKALMRFVYAQYARQYPEFRDFGQRPVIYIEVPAASTGKLLMRRFADFFGQSGRSSESMGSIRTRIVDLIAAAGTQLIVVDELHNLSKSSAGNGESVDLLKDLHNDLAATFMYAGIDLTGGDLLAGPRGQQIAGRFKVLELSPYVYSNAADRITWKGLIASFEKQLLLHDHENGTLLKHKDYLYARTGGSLGSLGRLLTGSAIEAITNPDIKLERIDRDLLDTRTVDFTAETRYAQWRARPGRTSPPASSRQEAAVPA